MFKHVPHFALATIVAAAMTACGGGSGGNDPVSLVASAVGSSSATQEVDVAKPFSFTVTANSPDNALTSLSWTVMASAGAPAITASNLNCSIADKVDTPIINGLVSSVWKCTITGIAPASLGSDAVYTFTASAANNKGSKGTAVTTLRVKAPQGDASLPKVSVTAPNKATSGEEVEAKCSATGGFLESGQAYKFAWQAQVGDGRTVQFTTNDTATVKAKMPSVPSATSAILTCAVTDSAGKTGTSSASIEVDSPAVVASITGAESGASGGSIALTCAGAGGFVSTGGGYKFKWTSAAVGGKQLTFDNDTNNVVAVTLPSVTVESSFIANCEVTDEGGKTGRVSKAIKVAAAPAPAPAGAPAPSGS